MFWILSTIYSFLYNSLLDFVFFILVDVVAKAPLREATNNDEKRTIWLYESLILTVLSLLVYAFDHVPFLLSLLTVVTFTYTQLYGRIDFRYWWNVVKTRWEEHQQHEESMENMREQLLRQRQSPPANVAPFQTYGQGQPGVGVGTYGPNHTTATHLVSQRQEGSQREQRSWFWSRPAKWLSLKQEVPRTTIVSDSSTNVPLAIPVTSGQVVPPPPKGRQPEENVTPARGAWYDGKELRRRPLRSEASTLLPKPLVKTSVSTTGTYFRSSTNFQSKVLSAFGMGGQAAATRPPGLVNKGQNLCFLNSIVQSLCRSPHLITCLTVDAAKELECTMAESQLLATLAEVLHQCSSQPSGDNGDGRALDPAAFRQAVSALNRSLVAPYGQAQTQQDAAEFLMWLLETVHNILNKNRKALLHADKTNGSCRGEERFSSPTLAMLKFIYGDLNLHKIQDLKDACRREIELANGLENESYAESIQRLSDLEWLHHKQDNESLIDDLFTGQLVEAYHCLTDNHISVNLQAFNILPVPIAAPRQVSGVVYLEDCFTNFCHIEHLMSPEEMNCTYCRSDAARGMGRGVTNDFLTSPPRTQSVVRASSADSAFDSPSASIPPPSTFMSPILGQRDAVNDSGFHDNVFRTSTPITEACKGKGSRNRHVRDVQRRCLLRQLPECLAIQLMRFSYDQRTGRSTKIKAPVSIRIRDLDLTDIIYDTVTRREDLTALHASQSYDLYSVCVHLGADNTNHGHYVSYSVDANGAWYRFDDEAVSEVNMEYELTTRELRENAYILFYKRVSR